MKKLIILFFAFAATFSVQAQSKTYATTLKKYMEATGGIETFKSVVNTMMTQFKPMYPSVPDEVWAEFSKEFSGTTLDDLVTLMAPVYEKHLTEADLNEVIKFYNTPVGKKVAGSTPAITQESMAVGQTWGMQVAGKIQAKMKEKGY
jgi:uncharacterized protein